MRDIHVIFLFRFMEVNILLELFGLCITEREMLFIYIDFSNYNQCVQFKYATYQKDKNEIARYIAVTVDIVYYNASD